MRLHLQPAYLLHRRAYRDSSDLLELLTAEHGRIGAIGRGLGRRRRGGAHGALLQPFRPLLISLTGRGDLLTMTGVEAGGDLAALTGDAMLCGFYANELLLRALQRFEAHPGVFVAYGRALERLGEALTARDQALALRELEFSLLSELGYAIDCSTTSDTGAAVEPTGWYRLLPGEGVVGAEEPGRRSDNLLPGQDLLAIAAGRLGAANPTNLKRIARALLSAHLGPEPLRSQEVFRSLRQAATRS